MINHPVVYAADRSYLEPLEAAIKSLSYHNDHLTIYVINADIPQEWFSNINRYLRKISSVIIDRKIDLASFQKLSKPNAYLSYMAYGRLLIPRLITDPQVLYLDCDTIVTGDLTPLFDLNLAGNYVAAVRDSVVDGFNSGVMVINNQLIRQHPEKLDRIFSAGQAPDNEQADQSALNTVFGKNYLALDDRFNYMVGSESDLFYSSDIAGDFFERLANCHHPLIVHYTSAGKPWFATSGGRMRELWWQYRDAEWTRIIDRQPLPPVWRPSRGQLFLFTQSEDNQNIRELAEALPDFNFYIGAWTEMGQGLLQLLQVPNIHLYPAISGPQLDELIHQQVAYLDIAKIKEAQVTQQVSQLNKPILTFESVADPQDYSNYHIFADHDIPGMAAFIRNLSTKEENAHD